MPKMANVWEDLPIFFLLLGNLSISLSGVSLKITTLLKDLSTFSRLLQIVFQCVEYCLKLPPCGKTCLIQSGC